MCKAHKQGLPFPKIGKIWPLVYMDRQYQNSIDCHAWLLTGVLVVLILCLLSCKAEHFRRHAQTRGPMKCITSQPENILTVGCHQPTVGAGRYSMIGPYYRAPSADDTRQRYPDAFGWRDSGRPGDPLEIQKNPNKENFGVCKDCDVTIPDREIPRGGFSSVNPFIYPYSGSECLDEIQSISSTHVPLTHATTPDHVVLTN